MLKEKYYSYFENASKEDVDKAVNTFSKQIKDLLISILGVNSKYSVLDNQERVIPAIKKIKKRLYKQNLLVVFSDYDEDLVTRVVNSLKEEKREAFLKEYSFKNNEVKEDLTEEEKKWNYKTFTRIENKLLKEELKLAKSTKESRKYKRNLYEAFSDYDKDKVYSLVSKLNEEELNFLRKEYSFVSNEEKEELTDFEKRKNYYTLCKINKALLNNKNDFKREYSFNTKNYKGLFNQVNEEKDLVLEAIELLPEHDRKLLKLKYGEEYSNAYLVSAEITDEINGRIIRKIKRKIKDLKQSKKVKITDIIDEDIDIIRLKVKLSRKETKEKVYSVFGEDLTKEVTLVGNKVALKQSVIKAIKNINVDYNRSKTLSETLCKYKEENESNEAFLSRITNVADKVLNEYEKELLKRKYGTNLDETVRGKDLTKEEKYLIDHSIVYKIKNGLKKYKGKDKIYYKSLDNIFTKKELELIKVYIRKLSEEEQTLLKTKYGEDFMSPAEKGTLSNEELEVIKKILHKFERDVVKDSNMFNVSNNSLQHMSKIFNVSNKTLLYMRRLTKTSEYERIKDIYGEKEALGIMSLIYARSITLHDIELVTGLTLDKIEVLANCYLDNVDRNVHDKLLRTRKHD